MQMKDFLPEMLAVVKVGLDVDKLLQLVHHVDWVVTQLLSIDDKQLHKNTPNTLNANHTVWQRMQPL